MKVVLKPRDQLVDFSTLKIGDTFLLNNKVYLVVNRNDFHLTYEDDFDQRLQCKPNVVDLTTNSVLRLKVDLVTPINLELVEK